MSATPAVASSIAATKLSATTASIVPLSKRIAFKLDFTALNKALENLWAAKEGEQTIPLRQAAHELLRLAKQAMLKSDSDTRCTIYNSYRYLRSFGDEEVERILQEFPYL